MKLIFMNKYLHLVVSVMQKSQGPIDIIHILSAAGVVRFRFVVRRGFGEDLIGITRMRRL